METEETMRYYGSDIMFSRFICNPNRYNNLLQYGDNVTILVTVLQCYNITISYSDIAIQYDATICYNI